MHWDWENRSLKLSAGELARFSLSAHLEERSGRWRVELGSHWHQVLRARVESGEPGWSFEKALSGTLFQDGWHFTVSGRLDQLKPGSEPILREVKTLSRRLPVEESDLRALYPQYFHQAMLYAFLLARSGPFPRTELLFLEIETGMTQTVVLDDRDMQRLHSHLESVAGELEERRRHFHTLRSIVVPEPFAEWRKGQPESRMALAEALESRTAICFEAPTGFGKTAIVLEQALRTLASGSVERILILTGKNTGHSPILDQLATFKASIPELSVLALRSRKDHLLDREMEALLSRAEIMERWAASGLNARELMGKSIPTLEELRGLGQRHGIPPWAISRMLLPYADVWIADYNYLFDPGVMGVLEGLPQYNPERTFLIVDEAHNLPGRAAASRSHFLDRSSINEVLTEIQFARFPGKLAPLLDRLQSLIKQQSPADSLDPPLEADLTGLIREIVSALLESSFGEDELTDPSMEWLWGLPYLLADTDHPDVPLLAHSPAKGSVYFACLEAKRVIGPVLARFHRTVLMSATLRPWEAFCDSIGLAGQATCLLGASPWMADAFRVVVDARVDTRFRRREAYLEVTASAIGETALAGKGCVVAFFPSYHYAQMVLERMPFLYPALRVEIQPRDLPLEEQEAFLEYALHFDDVLFLILGSRFSEGIDSLGGRVRSAIVVSPALPEVNHLQKAREALVKGGSREAFKTVYLIPGIRKISQALGRLVRSPGQTAQVLLHGKRFMEPDHQDLLPEYLRPHDCIVTDEEFRRKWLQGMAGGGG